MNEKYIERKVAEAVKVKGGMALKFVSPGRIGVPDRLILMRGGKLAFAELKSTGMKMRSIQIKRKRELEELGFKVYCIDKVEQIGEMIDAIEKE